MMVSVTHHDDDFFEEDQPVEDVLAAFDAGTPVEFAPPGAPIGNLSEAGWIKVKPLRLSETGLLLPKVRADTTYSQA